MSRPYQPRIRVTLADGPLEGQSRWIAPGKTSCRVADPEIGKFWYELCDDGQWRRRRGTVHTRTCQGCEREFQQQRRGPGKPRYYCDKCDMARGMPKMGGFRTDDCAECGTAFTQVIKPGKPSSYCEPCRAEKLAAYLKRRHDPVKRRARALHAKRLVTRKCDDCGRDFEIKASRSHTTCRGCRRRIARQKRLDHELLLAARRDRPPAIRVTHGMQSLIAQQPVAAAWAEQLKRDMLHWDPAYETTLEMYALTVAQIQSGYAWIEEQRAQKATIKDLLAAEQLLDTRLRIAIKLASELGLTPRSAIAMAKDAGTAKALQTQHAFQRVHQHLLEQGDGEAA